MIATTLPTEPVLYQVWFRPPGKGSRWRKAGRYATSAEAYAAIGGKGDWHIAPLCDERLAGSGSEAGSRAAGEDSGGRP